MTESSASVSQKANEMASSISTQTNAAQSVEINEFTTEMKRYYSKNGDILKRFTELSEELRRNQISSYEALAEQNKRLNAVFIELALNTEPAALPGNSFAFFGKTGRGKSAIINKILGKEVAKEEYGGATINPELYLGANFFVWDIPGNNDEVSYMNTGYISMLKGLTHRLIVVQSTLKENSSLMKLLDSIELDYDIVVNKFDLIREAEQNSFREQIDGEITQLNLRRVGRVFFISATNPGKFPDWMAMVQYLTN